VLDLSGTGPAAPMVGEPMRGRVEGWLK
jgi:hypothetical protein